MSQETRQAIAATEVVFHLRGLVIKAEKLATRVDVLAMDEMRGPLNHFAQEVIAFQAVLDHHAVKLAEAIQDEWPSEEGEKGEEL